MNPDVFGQDNIQNTFGLTRSNPGTSRLQVEVGQNQVLDKIFNAVNAPVEILDQVDIVFDQLETARERILDQLDQLEPGENPEENKDEDEDHVMPLTEKDRNDAAYKSFKNQLESLMTQKIAKKFLKLSFDEMRTRDDCKEKGICDTLNICI